MSDPLDDELIDWLRMRATPDPGAMADASAAIDRLPDRRRRRPGWMYAAASIALAIAGLALVVPQVDGPGGTSIESPLPDPAAFDDDPRLALCGSGSDAFLTIFEMAHIADYARHLPNAYPLIGLQVDPSAPVLVMVYEGPGTLGRMPLLDSPRPFPSETEHDLCIVVGAGPATWESAGIARVDITGLRVNLAATAQPNTPTPTASSPTPLSGDALPDPGPFRNDPRTSTCQDHPAAVSAFEVAHARDMRLYLPSFSGWEPELLSDQPALVLVMGPDYPAPPFPGPSGAGPPPSSGPTDRYLCIVVGSAPPFATGYRFVSIVGFDADPVGLDQAGGLTGPCPEAWRKPMSLAWGHIDDLLAPRDVVPNRRELIVGAIALVERTPDWGPGDEARRSLADALAALDDAERAYQAADPAAEARALDDAGPLIEAALQAYEDLASRPSAPCYTVPEDGAGG